MKQKQSWAESIMDKVIWGNDKRTGKEEFERRQEIVQEARRLVNNDKANS